MAPTILHVEAIQDHQARVRPPCLLIVLSSITGPDLVQNVARLRHWCALILRESACLPLVAGTSNCTT